MSTSRKRRPDRTFGPARRIPAGPPGARVVVLTLIAALGAVAAPAVPASSGASGARDAVVDPFVAPLDAEAPDDGAQRRRRRGSRHGREIDRSIEVLGLEPGDVVAEIGAGDGRFSLRFARAVGPGGKVYANELSSRSVGRIRERAEEAGLDNLEVVQGAVDDTNLPDGCCDAMMMRMVYHMLTDPEPMSRSFYRALRPGGRLLILEGDPEPDGDDAEGVPANRAGMGIDPQIVIDELAEVGFDLERHIPDWTGADYALVFRKPGLGTAGGGR